MSSMKTGDNHDQAVTVVVSRRVRKGCEEQFEQLSTAMSNSAATFPGHLGSTLLRPASPDDPEYRIVFKFSTPENLARWQESDVRLRHLESFDGILVEPAKTEMVSGMVAWFTLPSQNPVKPPPRYKMTLVSWMALYPSVTLIFLLFGSVLEQIPLLLRTLMITGVLMLLMSYVLMPRFTRWFAFWLYPQKDQDRHV
ncbi:MAG: antibiotic biosynthesis monooxygenase [Thiopseudomonas sp.]